MLFGINLDMHTVWSIPDPTGHTFFPGQLKYKWPESHPLHLTFNMKMPGFHMPNFNGSVRISPSIHCLIFLAHRYHFSERYWTWLAYPCTFFHHPYPASSGEAIIIDEINFPISQPVPLSISVQIQLVTNSSYFGKDRNVTIQSGQWLWSSEMDQLPFHLNTLPFENYLRIYN